MKFSVSAEESRPYLVLTVTGHILAPSTKQDHESSSACRKAAIYHQVCVTWNQMTC